MRCPYCGEEKTAVRETTDYTYQVGRKRLCPKCGKYFLTLEQLAELKLTKEAYANGGNAQK
ncbi:MAG: hypothetical protein Q4F74_04195 [Synergistaceae bacterium]|nr:hypothetical protein [Synergistaceae bacterium]